MLGVGNTRWLKVRNQSVYMKLPPFLVDHWFAAHEFASPPIRFNLASSTGPAWMLSQLLALGDDAARDELDSIPLSYAPLARVC